MRHYAAAGFVVAAPDMFSRTVPGPLGQSEEDRAAARGRLEGFDVAAGMADVRTVIDALRARPDCTGAVAVVGYCFGGEFAYLATTQLGAAAAVSFHGVGIGKHLDQAGRVNVPMSLHFGADDRFVPNSEVDAIEAAAPRSNRRSKSTATRARSTGSCNPNRPRTTKPRPSWPTNAR